MKEKDDYKPAGHTRFTMNMREDLHEDLRTYCFVNKENMSSVIEELIEKHLNKPSSTDKKVIDVKAKDIQVGGNHYKDFKIQPIEYIQANDLSYCEANVIKYVTRWRSKNGIEDLRKAKHYIDLLIESEVKEPNLEYLRE